MFEARFSVRTLYPKFQHCPNLENGKKNGRSFILIMIGPESLIMLHSYSGLGVVMCNHPGKAFFCGRSLHDRGSLLIFLSQVNQTLYNLGLQEKVSESQEAQRRQHHVMENHGEQTLKWFETLSLGQKGQTTIYTHLLCNS